MLIYFDGAETKDYYYYYIDLSTVFMLEKSVSSSSSLQMTFTEVKRMICLVLQISAPLLESTSKALGKNVDFVQGHENSAS